MFNIGILGCGNIAATMAKTVNDTEGVRLYAVAAREKEKADNFKAVWNAEKSYGSYEELLADSNVNLVYIATITSLHKEHMMAALNVGKPVLCEKSFTVNRKEAEEVFALAKKKNLLHLSVSDQLRLDGHKGQPHNTAERDMRKERLWCRHQRDNEHGG